ncbi:MAG: hypothetical protein K9G33_00270 [Sneathiella sp.]|nr:hypothetical protein [Sneathiella sp.]
MFDIVFFSLLFKENRPQQSIERNRATFLAIVPIRLIKGVVTGDYDKKLGEKIRQIKSKCGGWGGDWQIYGIFR